MNELACYRTEKDAAEVHRPAQTLSRVKPKHEVDGGCHVLIIVIVIAAARVLVSAVQRVAILPFRTLFKRLLLGFPIALLVR